jgi:hypothetical protein
MQVLLGYTLNTESVIVSGVVPSSEAAVPYHTFGFNVAVQEAES